MDQHNKFDTNQNEPTQRPDPDQGNKSNINHHTKPDTTQDIEPDMELDPMKFSERAGHLTEQVL